MKRVGQPPKQCPPGRWGPTRPDEPMTDVPGLARRVPRGGRISLRSQPCRKKRMLGESPNRSSQHIFGVPKIEMCTALPLSGDSLRAAWRRWLPSPSARRERAQFAGRAVCRLTGRASNFKAIAERMANLAFILGHYGRAVVAHCALELRSAAASKQVCSISQQLPPSRLQQVGFIKRRDSQPFHGARQILADFK